MTGAAAAVKRGERCRRLEIRPVRRIEIAEARDGGVELQFDGARRTVTLLADDHLGFALDPIAFSQPFIEFLAVRFHRLAHLVIIFLAEHEQHHVGVLLDRA